MRVLVLIHEFPPVGGGGGKVAEDLCEGLAKYGYQIRVLSAHFKGLPFKEEHKGFEVIRVRSGRRYSYRADLLAMFGYLLSGFWKGMQIIRQWKPELIHVHFAVPAGVLAFVLSRLTGVPYVLTAHMGDIPGGVPSKTAGWFRWIQPFTPPIWRSASRVIAVSSFGRNLALQHYPVKIEVIPNGVDISQLSQGEIRPGKPPQVVFVGRFMLEKNPVQVVRIMAGLKDLSWRCVMVGDGPLRPDVEAEIDRYHLGDRITLTDWVSPEEAVAIMAKSDLLLMPSLSEGLPVVGVQALALGLAVVASQVGGCIDLVQPNENGFLLPVNDLNAFQEKVRYLIGDPEKLQAARSASRKLAARFDLDEIIKSYDQVYRSVC
jgi:glycosyltransferase involved in cell wall biosynthesis